MKKEKIYSFLNKKIHAVVSTCGDNHQPEAALIGFGQTDKLELIFGTSNQSRKYQNLHQSNKVALVIGWDDDSITVQYEGYVTELAGEEKSRYVEIYHQKVPAAIKYSTLPDQVYFKITPIWVRYSDLSNDSEPFIFELSGDELLS
jgi:general stress protein 26